MKTFHWFFFSFSYKILGHGRTMSCLSGQSNNYNTSPQQLHWSTIKLVFLMCVNLRPALGQLLKISLILKCQENKQRPVLAVVFWFGFLVCLFFFFCKRMTILKMLRLFCICFGRLEGASTLRSAPKEPALPRGAMLRSCRASCVPQYLPCHSRVSLPL